MATTTSRAWCAHLLTTLLVVYSSSLGTKVTADNVESSSLAPSVGGGEMRLEMRKLRHIEAELEVLRRTVTDMKAGGQCGSQSQQADTLKDMATEIQGLRSQFQALQMRRDLSAIRSDILLAQSMLADTGSRRSAMLEDDARRTLEAGSEQPGATQSIPSTLSTGVVYQRWGHESCSNDTELVYSGVIAGSIYNQSGAAANALCLPLNPVLENNPGASSLTSIFGAEYQVSPLPNNDLDPRCAVCQTPRAAVVMVPAVSSCHPGWTLEYSGYLMTGYHTHAAASEFLCFDKEQHTRIGSNKNDNGKLFYYVSAACGSLPCPPYVNGKVLPCVVCSK